MIAKFDRRETVLNCCLLLILLRWRWMGMRPVIVLIHSVGDIQKVSVIYITVIFLSFLRE